MPKTEGTTTGNLYVCQQASCRKNFARPVKVTNLQQALVEPYDGCPFCLTKVNSNSSVQVEVASETVGGGFSQKPLGCPHYLGYLSEASHKGQFGDECLVCPVILQCMKK